MFKRILAGLALALWLQPVVGLADNAEPYYLDKSSIPVSSTLGPPPQQNTPEEKQDFAEILRLQGIRSSGDCARAASEETVSLEAFFGPPAGPLSAKEVAKLAGFFDKIRLDTYFFTHRLKNFWHRPRPYDADKRITPCIHREPTAAYPSGHAATARVYAAVLTKILPERGAEFAHRADEVARDRVLGGVHHPTDIAAGKVLGDKIFQALLATRRFADDLSAAEH